MRRKNIYITLHAHTRIRAHTHAHTRALSLSLSLTHTHIYIYNFYITIKRLLRPFLSTKKKCRRLLRSQNNANVNPHSDRSNITVTVKSVCSYHSLLKIEVNNHIIILIYLIILLAASCLTVWRRDEWRIQKIRWRGKINKPVRSK